MSGIDSDLIRGHIDTIILKSLYTGDKYGLEIIQEVEEKTGGNYELKQPTLYSCLKRLETQGLLSSYTVDSEVGGRRRYYKLTEQGVATYRENQQEWLRSRKIIDSLIYNTEIEYDPIYADGKPKQKPAEAQEEISKGETVNYEQAETAKDEAETEEIAEDEQEEVVEEKTLEDEQEIADEENIEKQEEFVEENDDEQVEDAETIEEQAKESVQDNYNNYSTATTSLTYLDGGEDEPEDEFISYDDMVADAGTSFFDANSEIAEQEEEVTPTAPVTAVIAEDLDDGEQPLTEPTSLDISNDYQEDKDTQDVWAAASTEPNEEPEMVAAANDEIYSIDEALTETYEMADETGEPAVITGAEKPQEDDNDIYSLDNEDKEEPQNSDDEIYTPETSEPEVYSPTYINFGTQNNTDEADITNVEPSDNDVAYMQDASSKADDDAMQQSDTDDYANYGYSARFEDDLNNYQEPEPIEHASAEEINNLYKTTENYENLQAGYTDETYKQMLSELESYSSTTPEKPAADNVSAMSLQELTSKFAAEGITIRRHTKHYKESNESKLYIKTNEIKMVKSWITFGVECFALLLTFLIMLPFKNNYTFNFAFWPFVVTMAACLVFPAYYSIKFALDKYKKVVAKYAPRLNILLSVLITIQLMLIIYCVNLQLGFFSFSQENYNHLLWVIPLVLSFIPIIDALVYYPLFFSKKYHI